MMNSPLQPVPTHYPNHKQDKPTLEELVLQEEGFIHAEHLPLPFTAQEIMEVR